VTCRQAHDPIVPRDLFDLAQDIRRRRGFGHSAGIRTDYLLTGMITCLDCGYKLHGRKKRNNQGRVYYYYEDAGYDTYNVCKALHIPRDEIENFVMDQIGKLVSGGNYEARFRQHLKRHLIAIERDASGDLPSLRQQLHAIEGEINLIVDELLKIKSDALRKRLMSKEQQRDLVVREIEKRRAVVDGPSQIINLVNKYLKALNHATDILRMRTPREQKQAIRFFLDGGELMRGDGLIRFYFYDLPQVAEATWGILEGRFTQVGAGGRNRTDTGPGPGGF
jgi:hypothetical protein